MSKASTDEEQGTPIALTLALIALAAVLLGGVGVYFWVLSLHEVSAAAKWGSTGDSIGPFVALLNAGAVFAALGSIWYQRKELALQRLELAENREVMKEQAKHAQESAAAQMKLVRAQELNAAVLSVASLLELANGHLQMLLESDEEENKKVIKALATEISALADRLVELHNESGGHEQRIRSPLHGYREVQLD
jgi:hypothetical protein